MAQFRLYLPVFPPTLHVTRLSRPTFFDRSSWNEDRVWLDALWLQCALAVMFIAWICTYIIIYIHSGCVMKFNAALYGFKLVFVTLWINGNKIIIFYTRKFVYGWILLSQTTTELIFDKTWLRGLHTHRQVKARHLPRLLINW